ncbi:hypothetical protein BDA96_10G117000 [Sorghum bicolor]|uniref:Uncharacterized protein n=1 Tax=Sorghum bicolor TaxID=4558 RepID=A0A921U0P3_SORBI|nr:hypothetical protein BDA96_10G117000 [Sorghum bicolor]
MIGGRHGVGRVCSWATASARTSDANNASGRRGPPPPTCATEKKKTHLPLTNSPLPHSSHPEDRFLSAPSQPTYPCHARPTQRTALRPFPVQGAHPPPPRAWDPPCPSLCQPLADLPAANSSLQPIPIFDAATQYV